MKRVQIRVLVIFFVAVLATYALQNTRAADAPFKYIRTGSAADAPSKNLQGGFALIGGGKDLDEAFVWMCGRAGGGDFLIVRASGTDAYNPYVNSLCKQNSVATLIIPTREAALAPAVAQTIRQAEAIFIAGGDQSNYINFWTDTPVQAALNEATTRGVPIGGTSAGLAVLGEFVYSAQNDLPNGPNLTSAAALGNPFHNQITITKNFLQIPPLRSVITDSHFSSRDRLGRSLVFLARILQMGDLKTAHGIGIDEHTAVLVQPDGAATVAGSGAVYFFTAATRASVIEAGKPLSIANITVGKMTASATFDLKRWPDAGVHYVLSVENGVVHSTQPGGAIY